MPVNDSTKQKEHARRLMAIHDQRRVDPVARRDMDVRHEEFKAMTEIFLGRDYEKAKLHAVEGEQIKLRRAQMELYRKYSEKIITAEAYAERLQVAINDAFSACLRILGQADFAKLFGNIDPATLMDPTKFIEAAKKPR